MNTRERGRRPFHPDGDNSLASRIFGAFVGAFFAIPLCLAWWGWLALELSSWHVAVSWRPVAWAIGGFAAFGFAFPKLLPAVYGGAWDALAWAWRHVWIH